MNGFVLQLFDATHSECIEGVTSFVGEDASGSFGIQAGHVRLLSVLNFGLARYRCAEKPWQYLALPSAVLYFNANTLTLSTRHYLQDSDYQRISTLLQQQLRTEEDNLHAIKQSLRQMEDEVLKRLWQLGQEAL